MKNKDKNGHPLECDYCGGGDFHEHESVYATMELEVTDPDYSENTLVALTCDNCYEVYALRELTEEEQGVKTRPRLRGPGLTL
jgi:hypothetical protein